MPRESVLNVRHKALGSKFNGDLWNDYLVPWDYNIDGQNPDSEVAAARTKAGVWDVSMLRIYRVSGPDATDMLDYIFTRDIANSKKGQALLCNIVDPETGYLTDDATVFNDGGNNYRVVTGGGNTGDYLFRFAEGKAVSVREDLDTHIVSVQGPLAIDLLAPEVEGGDLRDVRFFNHMDGTIFGKRVNIARLGYSGERGYEIYCSAQDAVAIWDTVLEIGKAHGVVPCSWAALDKVRVESALMFWPYEMPGGRTIWESNMGWAIAKNKSDFMGRDIVMSQKGKERTKVAQITVSHHDRVEPGAKLYADGQEVGEVTSPSYSRYLMKSLALAILKPEFAQPGTRLEVRSGGNTYKAIVETSPAYDPMKLRLRPEQAER